METGNLAITATAIILGLGMLLGAGTKCSMDYKAALIECTKATQKPLECKEAIANQM